MLLSKRHRFLFIANTKAASTAIEAALLPFADLALADTPEVKHMALHRFLESRQAGREFLEFEPDRLLKFGVMRDPVEWIFSWYRYRLGNQVEAPLPQGTTFAQFWHQRDWNIQRPNGLGKYLQSDLFCNPRGDVLVDVIIRYDALEYEYSNLCELLRLSAPLKLKNVSCIAENPQIPKDLRAELIDFYKDDYALYAEIDRINASSLAKWKAVLNPA